MGDAVGWTDVGFATNRNAWGTKAVRNDQTEHGTEFPREGKPPEPRPWVFAENFSGPSSPTSRRSR